MEKPSLLIVEDSEFDRLLLSSWLKNLPWKLTFASNGLEALNIFDQNPEAMMILMDLNLPVLNGFEVLFKVKKRRPLIPVIAISACCGHYSNYDLNVAGFDGYVSKPMNREELFYVMAKYLPHKYRTMLAINYVVKSEHE